MKVTCKKTGKDMTRNIIESIEKRLIKDGHKIVTVFTSDPELLDKEQYKLYKSYHDGDFTI